MTRWDDLSPKDPRDRNNAVPSAEELDATDRLLDAIARDGVRAAEPEIELLRLAAGPAADAETEGAAGFAAALADAVGHRPVVSERRPSSSISHLGRVLAAKIAVLASLLAVGVAGAGAVTGVIAYTAHHNQAPDRLLRPEVTTIEPDATPRAPADDGRDERGAPTPTPTTADDGAAGAPRTAVPHTTTDPLDGTDPAGDTDPPDDTAVRNIAAPDAAVAPTDSEPTPDEAADAAGGPLHREPSPRASSEQRGSPDLPVVIGGRTTPAVDAPPIERPRPATAVAPTHARAIPWGVCVAGCSAPRATDPPTPAAASTSSRSSATSAPRSDASAPQPRGPR